MEESLQYQEIQTLAQKRENDRMYIKQFDTRWVTFPTVCLLAIIVGDVSWWVISLIIIGCFPVSLTLKRRIKKEE